MSLQSTKQYDNTLPGIVFEEEAYNPSISSPYCPYVISFYQTRETLLDIETYRHFLENAISRFRRSITYSDYKKFLLDLGLDRCQVHGNITAEMATLEMHHNILNIFDIALIITEHTLNTVGYITTFDLVSFLKLEHTEHNIQLVMLSKTPHQLYHNADGMFIHPNMCFGNWIRFLEKHNTGITMDIAYKLIYYINDSLKTPGTNDSELLQLREKILDWSTLI